MYISPSLSPSLKIDMKRKRERKRERDRNRDWEGDGDRRRGRYSHWEGRKEREREKEERYLPLSIYLYILLYFSLSLEDFFFLSLPSLPLSLNPFLFLPPLLAAKNKPSCLCPKSRILHTHPWDWGTRFWFVANLWTKGPKIRND